MKKIALTKFSLRHFNANFGGTKILDYLPEEFEDTISNLLPLTMSIDDKSTHLNFDTFGNPIYVFDGYAPFCKLLSIRNLTNAKTGTVKISLENYQYIRSGYSSRREDELPIFSRWLELPVDKPIANWLVLVLYSKEQIEKEAKISGEESEFNFDADWGVVAILGQSQPFEEPMKPETMIRNAGYNTIEFQKELKEKLLNLEKIDDAEIKDILSLQGLMNGGSGYPLDKKLYLESVDFWSKWISLK